MSVIEKMSIMGIRSFGPEDRNKQIIEFFKPLTLILGPNGSGKTTIIECLRYMTTGDMPPNTDRGTSFVHDPKIAKEKEIKGQVKLQLKDVTNKALIATRNLVTTQKAKKLTLKTLEGTVTRFGPDGNKASLSSKCAEIDKEMISALGVSKPILNNVIFCHQEESNWPLCEGKALKQKFDEIFAATRYIKALEEIKKIRAEKVKEVTICKAESTHLKENRRKAEEFSVELDKTQTRLTACKDSIQEVEKKLKPISDKLQEILSKEYHIADLQGKLESTKEVLKKSESDRGKLQISIKNLFAGTKNELLDVMENFRALISQKMKQLEDVRKNCTKTKLEHSKLLQTKSKLTENLGKLKVEHQQHKDRITSRDKKLCEINNQLGLRNIPDDESLSDHQVKHILQNWNRKVNTSKQELNTSKGNYETQENSVQTKVDKVRDSVSKKSQEQKSSNQRIGKNKNTIEDIQTELNQADSLASRQDDLLLDIAEAEGDLTTHESSLNINEMRKKITTNQSKKKEKDVELNNLQREMKQLQNESKTRTEIDLSSKDKKTKQDVIDKMLMRHKETVIHLLGNMPAKNVQEDIKKLIGVLNKENSALTKNLDKKRAKLSSEKTSKEIHVEHLKSKEELLSSHKAKILEVCGSQDFDAGFEELEKTLKDLQDEKGSLTGSLYLYNKYVEQLKASKPCCPLCTRGFQRNEEAKALITDLQGKLQQVPSQLKRKEKLISDHQKRLNSMLELRPLKGEVTKLTQKEIPELKSKIDSASSNISKLTDEITELEDALDLKQRDLKTANDMLPDLAIVDQNQRELERLERRLTSLTCQLGNADMSRTITIVGDEISQLQSETELIKTEIESDQNRISEFNDALNRFRNQLNQLKTEQVEIAGRLQKKNALEDQLHSLTAENSELTESLKQIKVDIAKLESEKQTLLEEKKTIILNKERDLEQIRSKIADEAKVTENIDKLTKDIERYISDGRETKLTNLENQITTVNSNIQGKDEEIGTMSNKEKELAKDISDQELKKREYEDNKRLMELVEEIAAYKTKCQTLERDIGGLDVHSIMSEKRKLQEKEKQLTKDRNENEGRQGELVNKVKELHKQLQDKIYKNADQRYREMSIQLKTTEMVCDDLNKYYMALDRAVTNYHRLKMVEINRIVKELWMQTYCGNDVDYIEIRSNEDDTDSGLEKRRVYNYKVVLVKGDRVVDMRSHCSAGQKVLASLLIRLALAEVFCLNCGILALDEPTTNLDRENICSLAKSLVGLVQSRSAQRNFQLIVITHDEDFIDLLGRSETVDYFYKVSKDENFCSTLSKCRISEMP